MSEASRACVLRYDAAALRGWRLITELGEIP